MKRRGLFLLVLLLCSVSCFGAPGSWEFFKINAQYRGSVKKGFSELGCAIGYFVDLGNMHRQVIFHACVRHPERKGEYYAFRVNLVYRIQGGAIVLAKEEYSTFQGLDPEHQEQIKDLILLLGEIRVGRSDLRGINALQINRTALKCNSAIKSGGRRWEFMVDRAGRPAVEGKFFLNLAQAGWDLDKFRIKREKISISFVTVPGSEIKSQFGAVAPYNQWVFGS